MEIITEKPRSLPGFLPQAGRNYNSHPLGDRTRLFCDALKKYAILILIIKIDS
jgi:hypothetical protein